MNYKVSVIIPVYNVEKYLRVCLDSIVKQTLKDVEIIIVDDGSTDSSTKIVDEYEVACENVKVFHKENGGQGSARNLGIRHATGEYIYYMDSDDYLDESALEILYDKAHKEDLDILLFAAQSFSDDEVLNLQLDQYSYPRKQYINTVMNGKKAFLLTLAAQEYTCIVCARFYKREYLLGTKVNFNEKYIHEDEEYGFLTYVEAERLEIIDNVLFYRRLRPGSTMTGTRCKRHMEGYLSAWYSLKQYYDNCTWKTDEKRILLTYILGFIERNISLYCNAPKRLSKTN